MGWNGIANGGLCAESTVPVTVPRSVSRSRRSKSPSTPDTPAPSAERLLSSATLSVSGTASPAARLYVEIPHPVLLPAASGFFNTMDEGRGRTKTSGLYRRKLTNLFPTGCRRCLRSLHTSCGCHPLDHPTSARDRRGLNELHLRLSRFKFSLWNGIRHYGVSFRARARLPPPTTNALRVTLARGARRHEIASGNNEIQKKSSNVTLSYVCCFGWVD